MSSIASITDSSFEAEVLESELPVLVDFWAEWCGPCKKISPILEEIAPSYADKIKILKLNVDQNSETPVKYSVRGIPTLILYKAGKVIDTKIGLVSKTQLSEFLDSHL